ncbi:MULTISPECIES: ACP S-malonyltransferase [unclassified Neptuniibacter]|uniref:ACP S-malonyltransferase n=1 Tax=unclassified Neptuniibacter TaxID=2630693 RepID=UPI000C60A319|nr:MULTISPECIES: ACP S-malonyltransferase [unclassified Neptuniibacter]MAY43562.1 [acyl-carrier-protein] S-malonyltransferase [Oceanospirillaceae bacterium]|tara:strand:- start:21607 stop:22539 length:933 start_codon:yes stop_codon:yes gene_type:complete
MSQNLAFVFPGQGSQQVGMLAELAEQHSIITDTFAEASEVLGYDLWDLVQSGPAEDLNQTDKTQPALLTSGVALWRLWQQQGGAAPAVVAGHSLGEYTALVCAGAIDFKDGVKLVKLRGEFMQQAVPAGTGAMSAILGLADDLIAQACKDAEQGEIVSPVNYNCPGQVVIAGHKAAVERAMELCKEAGAKRAIPLPVSVPSHCELMKPAAEKMAAELANIEVKMPAIQVVQNTTAAAATTIDELKENLLSQLYSPVLWTDSVQGMIEQGVENTVECGPGKVLSGLNKKIHRPLIVAAINDVAGLEKALSA